MIGVIAIFKRTYKTLSHDEQKGPIIQNEKVNYIARIKEFKASWEHIKCIVMSNDALIKSV